MSNLTLSLQTTIKQLGLKQLTKSVQKNQYCFIISLLFISVKNRHVGTETS